MEKRFLNKKFEQEDFKHGKNRKENGNMKTWNRN